VKLLRTATVAAIASTIVFGISVPADASRNSGWVYSVGGGAAAYFDADLNGAAGVEAVTICDEKANGRGAIVYVNYLNAETSDTLVTVKDPSHDDTCVQAAWNMFVEDLTVYVEVCEYKGGDYFIDCAYYSAEA
jgi:hypothetical protein